jgi:hypothetical protein
MQAVVTIRLYGYMDMNSVNKGKRDEIIKKFLLKINMQLSGYSGSQVPVALNYDYPLLFNFLFA